MNEAVIVEFASTPTQGATPCLTSSGKTHPPTA